MGCVGSRGWAAAAAVAVCLTWSRAVCQGLIVFLLFVWLCVVFLVGSVASAEAYRGPASRRRPSTERQQIPLEAGACADCTGQMREQ